MSPIRPALALLLLTAAAAPRPELLATQAAGDGPPVLSAAEFEKLHRLLRPQAEAWREVPWKLSVLEARDQAAREKKPVFLLVRSGHPLGCV